MGLQDQDNEDDNLTINDKIGVAIVFTFLSTVIIFSLVYLLLTY